MEITRLENAEHLFLDARSSFLTASPCQLEEIYRSSTKILGSE